MSDAEWVKPTHIVLVREEVRAEAWREAERDGLIRLAHRVGDLHAYHLDVPGLDQGAIQMMAGEQGPRIRVFPNRFYRPAPIRGAVHGPAAGGPPPDHGKPPKGKAKKQPASRPGGWVGRKVRADTLREHRLDGGGVVIAFVDSGINAWHESLVGAMAPVPYYDALEDRETCHWDRAGHGTRVASVALGRQTAAHSGIAPAARAIAVGVTDSFNRIWTDDLLRGLDWLVKVARGERHAERLGGTLRVVNLSLSTADDPAMEEYLIDLDRLGVLVVAAAGNALDLTSPAAYATTVAVGATDQTDVVWSRSANAPQQEGNGTFVVAPGVDVLAAFPTQGAEYDLSSGTSFAAPVVSAIAALLIQDRPVLTPAEVREILAETAEDLVPTGWDTRSGSGRVDATRSRDEVRNRYP